MVIRFINAVLDMHNNEATLLQIIRRIGNKHYRNVNLVSNLDIHGVPFDTKVRLLAYITLLFYSSMTYVISTINNCQMFHCHTIYISC